MSTTASTRRIHVEVAKSIQTNPTINWPQKTAWPVNTEYLNTRSSDPAHKVQYEPQTEFGKRMLALRRAVERSGVKMLKPDEVLEEARIRRGGSD